MNRPEGFCGPARSSRGVALIFNAAFVFPSPFKNKTVAKTETRIATVRIVSFMLFRMRERDQ